MTTIPLWMIAAAAGISVIVIILLVKSLFSHSAAKPEAGKSFYSLEESGALSDLPLSPGDKIGIYTIKKKQYDGETTITYLAQAEKSSFLVKIPQPRCLKDKAYMERFLREAKILEKLDHPNIVKLSETGTLQKKEKGREIPYMILEYIEGTDLGQIIREQSPDKIDLTRALNIIKGIAKALEVVHSKEVTHRNINPSNIRLTPAGEIKLLNFGISKATGVETITRVKAASSIALYMAPEEISDKEPDKRIDLYSLGVIFYKLITGNDPYEKTTVPKLLAIKAKENPPDPRTIKPSIPEPVAGIVMKLLKINPDERFESATALIEAIDRLTIIKEIDPSSKAVAGESSNLTDESGENPVPEHPDDEAEEEKKGTETDTK